MSSWLGYERFDLAPPFVNRTCTTCRQKFTIDPLEYRRPIPAPDAFVCSACRKQQRTVRNAFGLLTPKE